MAEMIQRAGRAARNPNMNGLFLAIIESWALDLPLDGVNWTDPDRPYVGVIKKNTSKQDRTSIASLHFAQSRTCLHKVFTDYLGDRSPQGKHYPK